MKFDFYKTMVILSLIPLIIFGILFFQINRYNYYRIDRHVSERVDKLTGGLEHYVAGNWLKYFERESKIEPYILKNIRDLPDLPKNPENR